MSQGTMSTVGEVFMTVVAPVVAVPPEFAIAAVPQRQQVIWLHPLFFSIFEKQPTQ